MNTPSPDESKLRRAHPLAAALIERLRAQQHCRVLDLGSGRGRNTAALLEAGFEVCSVADAEIAEFPVNGFFDGVLSTHALLHGTADEIARALAATANVLRRGAPFYATFGSKRDERYGKGTCIAADTFAPVSGDESGVAHTYFDGERLRELLGRHFEVESLEERNVDEIVGRWAHQERPQGTVHWIVRAHRLNQ